MVWMKCPLKRLMCQRPGPQLVDSIIKR
jgi:hypothetical protein